MKRLLISSLAIYCLYSSICSVMAAETQKELVCQKALWKNKGTTTDKTGSENAYSDALNAYISIIDSGDSFSWDYVHGMRGDSNGASPGNEDNPPQPTPLVKQTTSDGSTVYKNKIKVKEYDGEHTIINTKTFKSGRYDYKVVDETANTSFTFVNCK